MVEEVFEAILSPKDVVSTALLVTLVAIFAAQLLLGPPRLELACAQVKRCASHAGHRYRLVTAIFLHAGWSHLLSNSVTVARIGPRVTRAFGCEAHLLIFLVAGFLGNVASAIWRDAPHELLRTWLMSRLGVAIPRPRPKQAAQQVDKEVDDEHRAELPEFIRARWEQEESISLGASGGVYGQLGALLAAAHGGEAEQTVLASVLEVVAYSVISPLFDGSLQNVGHTAHLAGLASGLLLGRLLVRVRSSRRAGPISRALVLLLLCATLSGVAVSLRDGWRATRAIMREEYRLQVDVERRQRYAKRPSKGVAPSPGGLEGEKSAAARAEREAQPGGKQLEREHGGARLTPDTDPTRKSSGSEQDEGTRLGGRSAQRLAELKEMLSDGVITAAEYEAKRKEIIDRH